MDYPVISPVQFLDASAFNQAIQTLFGNNTLMGSILFTPGLFNHNELQYSSSYLQVTIDLPNPFAILFSDGILAQAHGVNDNGNQQSYEVDLTALVPNTGSVTAYIVASLIEIQQDPFTVTGPPAGHPDYNPNFQPSVAQATTQYSLAVSATTTAPNNTTEFELGRFTLSVGQQDLPAMDLNYQIIGGSLNEGPNSGVTLGQLENGSINPNFGNVTAASQTTTGNQTFEGTITQTPGQGANNSTPFAQYADLFSDAIMSGLTTAASSTLTGTLAAGDAYVLGQRVVYPGSGYTVAASTTSYLDLSDTGVLTVSTSSTVTANSLRLWEVVSSATAITGVTQVARDFAASKASAPLLAVEGVSSLITPTVTTSTTGGTIPASTTDYYIVLPVFADGSAFPNGINAIGSVTTGSGTATNSNTLSWNAVSDAVSYNIYKGTSGAVDALPNYGLIGSTTSLSFVDTGITPGAAMPGTLGSSFTVIPFCSVVNDNQNGWDTSTNSYTIPISGKWLVVANMRLSDGTANGISYSLNANSTVADSASDAWFMTPNPAAGQTARQHAINTRIATFNQGDTASMFSYSGSPTNVQACALTLLYMGV